MRMSELTDQALATRVGVSRPYITRIRSGERQPSLTIAVKLAEATRLPVEAFLRAA